MALASSTSSITVEDPPIDDVIEQVFDVPVGEAIGWEGVTDASLTVLSRRRRHLARFARQRRVVVQRAIQYRSPALLMIVAALRALVYLVVWRTVADENGSSVEGFTAGVSRLLHRLDADPSDDAGGRSRTTGRSGSAGRLSFQLLRPLNMINQRLSAMPAWGVVLVLIWLRSARAHAGLPAELHVALQVIAFVVAVLFAASSRC